MYSRRKRQQRTGLDHQIAKPASSSPSGAATPPAKPARCVWASAPPFAATSHHQVIYNPPRQRGTLAHEPCVLGQLSVSAIPAALESALPAISLLPTSHFPTCRPPQLPRDWRPWRPGRLQGGSCPCATTPNRHSLTTPPCLSPSYLVCLSCLPSTNQPTGSRLPHLRLHPRRHHPSPHLLHPHEAQLQAAAEAAGLAGAVGLWASCGDQAQRGTSDRSDVPPSSAGDTACGRCACMEGTKSLSARPDHTGRSHSSRRM
jgi:hypothetical protein